MVIWFCFFVVLLVVLCSLVIFVNNLFGIVFVFGRNWKILFFGKIV